MTNDTIKPDPAAEPADVTPPDQTPQQLQPSGLARPQRVELGRDRVVAMNCDVPFHWLPKEAHGRFLKEIRERVNAEFPDLYVRPRMVAAGESDEVRIVTPARAVAPGGAATVMSMDEIAAREPIKTRVTEIRDRLLRELAPDMSTLSRLARKILRTAAEKEERSVWLLPPIREPNRKVKVGDTILEDAGLEQALFELTLAGYVTTQNMETTAGRSYFLTEVGRHAGVVLLS